MAPAGTESHRIALDRVDHWVKHGAKPSDAVMKLVRRSRKAVAAPVAGA
jgi:small subunit ribosomal protein S16